MFILGANDSSSSDGLQQLDSSSDSIRLNSLVAKKKGRPSKVEMSVGGSGRLGARCSICNKIFNNSSALAKHKLTHSDERKYVCATCQKTFKRQDHLQVFQILFSFSDLCMCWTMCIMKFVKIQFFEIINKKIIIQFYIVSLWCAGFFLRKNILLRAKAKIYYLYDPKLSRP